MAGLAVKPLTVDFHESGFLDKLNQESKLGFWSQLSDNEKKQAGSPWGPSNPQALNRYSYVQNNPLRFTDPTGHWTFQISWGFTAFGAAGGRINWNIAFDNKGNVAILQTQGGGLYTNIGASSGPGVTVTNAETVDDLLGSSVAVGGQVGIGASIGGEWEWFRSNGNLYQGLSISGAANLQFLPGEGHGVTDYTVPVTGKFNYAEAIGKPIVEWIKLYLWAKDQGMAP